MRKVIATVAAVGVAAASIVNCTVKVSEHLERKARNREEKANRDKEASARAAIHELDVQERLLRIEEIRNRLSGGAGHPAPNPEVPRQN